MYELFKCCSNGLKRDMPNKIMFEIKPIHDLIVEEIADGLWIGPFKEYIKQAELDKQYKGYAWSTAIGL